MTRQKHLATIFLLISIILFCMVESHTHGKTQIDSSVKVTYASIIKLRHQNTNFWLHSHGIPIQRGGIFSVTAYREDDHGSLWQVLEQHDLSKKTKTYKDAVKCGSNIILYSTIVDYYLRTEDTTFGLTTQLLPLVHGIKPDQIDHGIVWNVQCVDKQNGQDLHYGDKIRLKHDTSGKYVSTDGSGFYTQGNCGRGCEIVGQLEIHAIANGHYEQSAVFEVVGGMSFDQQVIQQNVKEE